MIPPARETPTCGTVGLGVEGWAGADTAGPGDDGLVTDVEIVVTVEAVAVAVASSL